MIGIAAERHKHYTRAVQVWLVSGTSIVREPYKWGLFVLMP